MVGRRPDGYHLLDSIVVFAAAADTLRGEPADQWSLEGTGPFAAGLDFGEGNLVFRAARALAPHGVRPTRLVLTKSLPIASGIGGGSADAAATLRLLARLWNLDLDLQPIAAALGADVPVCLASRPARMRGIGDVLDPAPGMPPVGLVLVNPGVPVQTQAVFAARQGGFSEPPILPPRWSDGAALTAGLAALANDLEPAARALAPAIGDVLEALRASAHCRLARMSGSGATCFGLFDSPAEAQAVGRSLARPGWWCWGGPLAGPPDRP